MCCCCVSNSDWGRMHTYVHVHHLTPMSYVQLVIYGVARILYQVVGPDSVTFFSLLYILESQARIFLRSWRNGLKNKLNKMMCNLLRRVKSNIICRIWNSSFIFLSAAYCAQSQQAHCASFSEQHFRKSVDQYQKKLKETNRELSVI